MVLSNVARAIPDFHVLKIDRLANDLIRQGEDVIKLNLGKSEVPMRQVIADEMAKAIYDEVKREIVDAQGLHSLRKAIAKDYRLTHGVCVSPESIFVNNGTSPFLLALYLLVCDPGDEVLLPLPYYPPYRANTIIANITPRFYRIQNKRIHLEDFKKRFVPGKTKLVVVNSPGNPLGNVVRREEFGAVLKIVDGRAYVLSDEIYDGFVYRDNFVPSLTVAHRGRDKVIVLNGFSKIHHMYTRRLGYAIVPDELVEPMFRFQSHNVVCVDPVTQFAGIVSLERKQELIEKEIKREIETFRDRLTRSSIVLANTGFHIIEPEGSFYMPVDVSQYIGSLFPNSMSFAQKLLSETRVAVTPGEDFGLNNFFRIGLTNERVVEGMERIRDYVNTL